MAVGGPPAHASVGRSARLLALWLAGMMALFAGERIYGSGAARTACSAIGLGLVLASLAARALRLARSTSDWRAVEERLLALQALGVVALALYFAQSDLARYGGKPLEAGSPRLAGALAALWPALWTAAALGLALTELAYAAAGRAARLEAGRMRDALWSGVGLACALTFAFAAAYVASERDVKHDFSYFRTARPGESTRKLVRSFADPMDVALFFPPGNEVHEEVSAYFADLRRESPNLVLSEYDQALDPTKAKEMGVYANGAIVVSRGGRKERITLALELDRARTDLRKLDREVQRRLLAVAKPPRTAFLTTGHEERSRDRAGDPDKRPGVHQLGELLEDQGYSLRALGPAEGLATEIPRDATLVMVLGPQKPFLPEEGAALARYFDRGGRIFVALDPEARLPQKDLLAPLGLALSTATLANDQIFASRTRRRSDRANIVTGSFSSHPSVATLGRLGMRAPLILPGVGSLDLIQDRSKDLTVDFTIHALPTTFRDENGNFELDAPAESRRSWDIAAAVSRRRAGAAKSDEEGRAVVIGDSDFLTDGVLPEYGNPTFVLDSLRWLVGDEAIAGEIASEEDVPIAHTRKQDELWFYSTIFLAPAGVLGLGWAVTRRRRGGGRARP